MVLTDKLDLIRGLTWFDAPKQPVFHLVQVKRLGTWWGRRSWCRSNKLGEDRGTQAGLEGMA